MCVCGGGGGVQGMTEEYATCVADVVALVAVGNRVRSVGVTNMNAASSRSGARWLVARVPIPRARGHSGITRTLFRSHSVLILSLEQARSDSTK